MLEDLPLYFQKRQEPERVTVDCAHGRIETRKIWTTSALNGYLDFPHVGQAFAVERDTIDKKTGKRSHEIAYGITSRPEAQADARRVLEVNRGHWCIENCCHSILEAKFLLAAKLFELGRLSSGKAAQICGMQRFEFILAAGKLGIPAAELDEEDLAREFEDV